MLLLFKNDEEKRKMFKIIRNTVEKLNSQRYLVIMECWMSKQTLGDKLYRRPKLDADREEGLMISECKKDRTGKTIYYPFKRVNEKIVWLDKVELDKGHSMWDVFIEEGAVQEIMDKTIEKVDDAFFKKTAKELSDKHKDEFFATEDPNERMKILLRIMTEGIEKVEDQKKTMLEDADDTLQD
jgi:hypothetical protein